MWRRTRTPHEEFWGGRQIDIDYRLSHFYFIDLCATSTPCGIIHSLVTVNFLIMKHIGIYAGAVAILVTPAILFAQGGGFGDTWQTLIIVEDSSRMLEMISLWAKLIVAFSTSAMVWNLGRKMHGGVFGSVLAFFSIGMILVFLGFVINAPWFQYIDQLYLKMTQDSLSIIGYIFMGVAASKLLKVIKSE